MVCPGDITSVSCDAVVNAANRRLQPGGGVDGAIHRAAGPELARELRLRHPHGCPTGSAVLTGGHGLPARLVVHAVGPVWQGGGEGEPELLASAYRAAFRLAAGADCRSVAAPAISTGIYGFPVDLAAAIAVREALQCPAPIDQVTLVAFDPVTQSALERALEASTDWGPRTTCTQPGPGGSGWPAL